MSALSRALNRVYSAFVLVGREDDLRDLGDLLGDEPLVLLRGGWGVGKSALLRALAQRTRKNNPDLATYLVDASDVCSKVQLVTRLCEQMLLASNDEAAVSLALHEQPSVALLIDECDALDAEACAWLQSLASQSPGATLVCAARRALPFDALPFELPPLRTESCEGGSPAGQLVEQLQRRRSIEYSISEREALAIARAAHGNPRTIRLAVGLLGVLTPEQLLGELSETSKGVLLHSAQGEAFFSRFEKLQWPQLEARDRSLLALLAATVRVARPSLSELLVDDVEGANESLDKLVSLSLLSVDEEYVESFPLINQAVARLAPQQFQEGNQRWLRLLAKQLAAFGKGLEDPAAGDAREWFLARELDLRRVTTRARQAPHLDPAVAELLLGLATTLRIVGRPDPTLLRGLWTRVEIDARLPLIVEEARSAFVGGNWEQFEACAKVADELLSESPSGSTAEEAALLKYFAAWWKDGWLGEALAADAPATHPEICGLLGGKAIEDGDFAQAEKHYRTWLALSEERRLGVGIVMSSLRLSDILRQHGRIAEAESHLKQGMSVAKRLGSSRYEAMLSCDMADLELVRESYDVAMRYAEAAERTFARLGHAMLLAGATWVRGDISLLQGRSLDARSALDLTTHIYRKLGLEWQHSWVALRIAFLKGVHEGPDRALAEYHRIREARSSLRVKQDQVVFEVWRAAIEHDIPTLERYAPTNPPQGELVWREALIARRAFEVFRDEQSTPQPSVLRLTDDYAWFELVGFQSHQFRRETPMRRIASELFRARTAAPGEVLLASRLVEVGWPDDRSNEESLRNRLWVTMSRLRGLGLGEALQNVEEGYRIDPHVELEFV